MVMSDIRPVLSALLRNRTGAILVSLQVAIALAVLVNAIYIVKQRVDLIGRPTGMDVANMFTVVSSGFTQDHDRLATARNDLAWLRAQPGVVAATRTNAIPLSGGGSSTTIGSQPDTPNDKNVAINYFEVDEGGLETFGVKLAAGRNFRAEEIMPPDPNSTKAPPTAIITKSVARALFGSEDAVGKVVYDSLNRPTTIVGVIDHMHGSWVTWDKVDQVALLPVTPSFGGDNLYIVRTAPGLRDETLRKVEEYLSTSDSTRMIRGVRPLEYYRDRSYLSDRNMAIFLVSITALLAGVTALGIFALATFNVSIRTRQIGTRRAIGARRADIVRYFLVENWLVTTGGVLLGVALAFGVGYWLSTQYELPRLDLYYLLAGVLLLWALGQAAAWQPSRRAARISPSVATRTV
jgi:putative ABC transport system permease protein